MTASIGSIVDCFNGNQCYVVEPTEKLRNDTSTGGDSKIAASDLLLGDANRTDTDFKKVPLTSVMSSDFGTKLKENIRSFLTDMLKAVGAKRRTLILGSAIAQCESDIYSSIGMGIGNEAELRFAVADPILKLFCSFWNLTVWGNMLLQVAYCHIRPSVDGLYRDGTVHISREMHKQCFITRRETTSGAPKPHRYR